MSAGREILTISLEPKVYRALTHYMRAVVAGAEPVPDRFGRSTAINHLLRRALRRDGFDPDDLRLLGGRA